MLDGLRPGRTPSRRAAPDGVTAGDDAEIYAAGGAGAPRLAGPTGDRYASRVTSLRCTPIFALAVALGVAACGEPDREPDRPAADVMQGAPLFLPARLVSSAGSAESVEFRYATSIRADSVAAWYRTAFDDRGWDVVGDVTMADGSISLHVAREGPPLWVLIRPAQAGQGSEFSLIGAARDTARARP